MQASEAGQAGPQSPERAVAVLLTNHQGELLLQLRDDAAPIAPNVWCTVGGAIDPGEVPEHAAVRELAEETGLRAPQLSLWWHGSLPKTVGPGMTQWWVYTGSTEATTDDVVVGEGADIRFVPRDQVLERQLAPSASRLLARWINEAPAD
jgi:8-oxo-dGTP pyrophosphatase MutT (NUDIX family)